MDIQKMVDERMEELRSMAIRASVPASGAEDHLVAPEEQVYERRRFDDDNRGRDLKRCPEVTRQSAQDARHAAELSAFGQVIDVTLIEVAERVMSITERVAGDYARMEKDILSSRLAVLQSAEAVLDIAISLRRKARDLLASGVDSREEAAALGGVRQLLDMSIDREDNCLQDGRVSMHDHGVASLFRRT